MASTEQKQNNVIALLKQDHDKVKQAFAEYEKLGPYAYVGKKKLADEICAELELHTRLEEEIIYPAFRDCFMDEKALANEAKVEHDSAKALIAEIKQMDADEELFDAKVKVLSEYIDHHVKEEENEMFPLMQKSKLDLVMIGEKLAQRKQQLLQN